MNDNKHHIKQYNAADIQRYLKGELSTAEMHAMERAALDDPFLADAMDGMEQTIQTHGGQVITQNLQELKIALEEKAATTGRPLAPVRSIRWWKATAAALILITCGALAYNSFFAPDRDRALAVHTQEQKSEPAPATTPAEEQETADAVTSNPVVPAPVVAPKVATAKQEEKKKLLPSEQTASAPVISNATADRQVAGFDTISNFPARKQPNVQQPPEQVKSRSTIDAEKKDRRNKEELAENLAATEVVQIADSDAARKRANYNNANNNNASLALQNVIKGQVTDQFNRPLPNAFLTNEQNRLNFTTDRNGFFNIPVRDTAVDVSISANGFATQRVQLQNNAESNQIRLQPEFGIGTGSVLPAYDKKGGNGKMGTAGNGYRSIMIQDAEPVYGWVGYEQYLDKNKRVPPDAPDLHGDQVVTFVVSKKGELSAFKIAQSLSKEHDAEAIRLIKEGPSWKLLKGRKAKTTVIIQF